MSSKKDLVEAHAFNRRRLITAFVSGSPGGREVEPVRYGRSLVGGVVLAGLIVAGAAVSGFLKPPVPADWLQNGMVIGEESGSRFVVIDKQLSPVNNTASARLLLATDGALKVTYVPDAKIAERPLGQTVGIPGGPDLLPPAGSLVETGWSACTNSAGGIKVALEERPRITARPGAAFVVRAIGQRATYVIANGRRYAVPDTTEGTSALRALALDSQEPVDVPGTWLDLVEPGDPLIPFSVVGAGQRSRTGVSGLDTIGTPVRIGQQGYVLGTKGLLPLRPFAFKIYTSSGLGSDLRTVNATEGQLNVDTDRAAGDRPYSTTWPEDLPSTYSQGDSPCLVLQTQDGAKATAVLARTTDQDLLSRDTARTQLVQSGHGAVVRATTAGVLDVGQVYLVDATGTRYAVGTKGNPTDSLLRLGYGKVTPRPVPQAWTELFGDGPALVSGAVGLAQTP